MICKLRIIEVKELGVVRSMILLTPNERYVTEDWHDCHWLGAGFDGANSRQLQEPVRDDARLDWREATEVAHCHLSVDAMSHPIQVQENSPPYGGKE